MEKRKRQRFKEGSIVKIELSGDKLIFGRLLPGKASGICVYDSITSKNDPIRNADFILSRDIILYCGIYRDVITKGIFEIVDFKEFTEAERNKIKPFFSQDLVDIDDCMIFWLGGNERKASPKECIGLEPSSVWEAEGLIQRIEDHYACRLNFHVELDKVILSKDDPRYLSPPQALRWDFEKQVFYRTDK